METHEAQKWRWLIFVAAGLETFLFGGLIFGWGSLVYVLKQDGIFSHLCANATNNSTNSHLRPAISDNATQNSPRVLLSPVRTMSDAHNSTYSVSQPTGTVSTGNEASVDGVTSDTLVTCVEQDNMLSLCFSVSAGILYTSGSIVGALSYKAGTRITRLVGWLSFTVGSLLTAFASYENPWLLFPGLPLLGFGGAAFLITNIQVGTLFSKGSSTVIAALSGVFDTSSVVMLFVKFANEGGLSRRGSMLILCGLHVLTLFSTLVLMPRRHFSWNEELDSETVIVFRGSVQDIAGVEPLDKGLEGGVPSRDKEGVTQTHSIADDALIEENDDSRMFDEDKLEDTTVTARSTDTVTPTRRTRKKPIPPLKECLLSVFFVMEVCWIALLQLRFSYFLGSLNPWLVYLFQTTEEVSHFTNVSMYSMMCGLPLALLAGAMFDFFKHLFSNQKTQAHGHLYATVAMLSVVSSVGTLMSVAVLIPTREALYASCVLTATLRSFIYSVDANVVTHLFPPQYFGALFGVSDFVGGAVSTLQYALVVWHESAGFNTVNYFMLAVAAVTFAHPVVQLCRAVKTGDSEDPQLQSLAAESTALPQSVENGETMPL